MRVVDLVVLSTPSETIVIAPADAAFDATIPRATANRAGQALRLHAGDARAMSDLRGFWMRHSGGGHRTSNPQTPELIDLTMRGVSAGRFTAFCFVVPSQVIPSNLAGVRGATLQRMQQIKLQRAGVGQSAPQSIEHVLAGGASGASAGGGSGASGKSPAAATKPPALDVGRMDLADRIFLCFEKAMPLVPGSMRAEVRGFLEDPAKIGTVVALMVAWAGLHAVAVGEVLDGVAFAALLAAAILEGASLSMSFFALMDAVTFLVSFLKKVVAARREADLDEAAADLAQAIAAVGVQLILIMAAKASAKLKTSAVKVKKSGPNLSKEESDALKGRMQRTRGQSEKPPQETAAPKKAEDGAGKPPVGKAVSKNNYDYELDEAGRTKRAKGSLSLKKAARDPDVQRAAGGADRLDTDQGGHLVGSRFNGSSDAVNSVAQNQNLNQGAWKAMENSWARALKDGKDVYVDITPKYAGDSLRPDSFLVKYTIDGVPYRQSFQNVAGQKF